MRLPFEHDEMYGVPGPTPDIKKGSAKVTVHGKCTAYVENYRCVLSCSEQCILIKAGHMMISVNGCHLQIVYYCPEELKISGEIEEIQYTQI